MVHEKIKLCHVTLKYNLDLLPRLGPLINCLLVAIEPREQGFFNISVSSQTDGYLCSRLELSLDISEETGTPD